MYSIALDKTFVFFLGNLVPVPVMCNESVVADDVSKLRFNCPNGLIPVRND